MENTTQSSQLHFLDYWRVIRSRKEIIIVVVLVMTILGVAYNYLMPNIYKAESRISVREDNLDIQVFKQGEMMAGYNPFFLRTQYEIIQSSPILYQVIQAAELREKWSERYSSKGEMLTLEETKKLLERAIKVEQYRDTSLIAIQAFDEDRDLAARIAQTVASVYREYRISLKRAEIKRAIETLENELKKQQVRVDEAETNLQSLRSKLGVTMLSKEIRPEKVRLSELEGDRIDARVDMLTRKARMEQVANLSGDELMNSIPFIVQDPTLITVRSELMKTEVELKNVSEQYGSNHPEVKRLVAARNDLREKLNSSLEGLKRGLTADYEVSASKYKALEEELSSAKDKDISAEGEKFAPYSKAERELDVQRSILEALQARVAQEGIEMEVPRTAVEIVQPAEPSAKPVSPVLWLNVAVSLILGLLLGLGMAYFIEYLDTSVKTVEDVENYLKLPVIGIIPQKVRPLLEEGPDSKHAESYRLLRANLLFTTRETGGKVFSFMSGGVGEGKSTTLFNLAYICATLGDKVLIVDSDMRRPVQHKMLKASNKVGLTDVLLKNEPVEPLIQSTPLPNLFFLPSGRLPRGSVGLLDVQKIKDLVLRLRGQYDYVFFDSPPVMGISDASILSCAVDGVLLVVQYRKYPRSFSLRAKKIGDNIGAKFVGVVLNNINIVRDDYYYYYHSYDAYYHDAEKNTGDEADEKGKKDAL